MQTTEANNNDEPKNSTSSQPDPRQSTDASSSRCVEQNGAKALTQHARRLSDAIERTGLGDSFDFQVDEKLIHNYYSPDTPEIVRDINEPKLPCNTLLLAARYFTGDQSYEIIGFRISNAKLSGDQLALEVFIEVIAEIATDGDSPVLNVLFWDVDRSMGFLMLSPASYGALCECCKESERNRIDSFFESSIHFLKQIVVDPRLRTV